MTIYKFILFSILTVFLYTIGYMFTIPFLMLRYEYVDQTTGHYVTIGSVLPFLIGMIVSFIAGKIGRHHKHTKIT